MSNQTDDTDRKILEILCYDARISMTELGKRVHLTSQAVKNRLEKLSDLGIVEHYTVNVNCPVYGYKVHAIIKINLANQAEKYLSDYLKDSKYNIIHLYQITGLQAYIIDGYFIDNEELQKMLQHIGQYGSYEIQLVLKEISLARQ
ncbi:MAG: Lrp/AsnC family transcriptional regulator [Selenomonadaceae bacterium]|nr:Lrp/AsnC family transcriptional regulator [Selenomonadaceae bacterium]